MSFFPGNDLFHLRKKLCSRTKALFIQSRESLGSRGLMRQLRKEGFVVGRYRVRRLMKYLQRV
ncbi:MAG: transposase, partial [Gammaproteobacteria bacterium]|nr:transposase [Gammaproteobacteria bacterium]